MSRRTVQRGRTAVTRRSPGSRSDRPRAGPARHGWSRTIAVVGALTAVALGTFATLHFATGRGGDATTGEALERGLELPRIEDPEGLDPRLRQSLEVALARAESERTATAVGELGRLYNAHHYLESARRCYELARALDSRDPEWPYHLALLAAERGELESAIGLLRTVLELRPDYLPARSRLGDLLLTADRPTEARAVFSGIASGGSEEPWGALGLGKVELRLGAHQSAIEHLERALRLAPEHAETRYLLATAYRDLGRTDRAAELLRGLEQGTRPARPSDALLRRVLENRQDLQATIKTANALLAAGRVDEAEALYRSVLEYDPQHYDASYDLGVLYGRTGRYEQARESLEAAVKVRPASADARLALAMAYSALGQLEAARSEASAALELAPDDPRARRLLAGLGVPAEGV
ncbi:MAG TPA: tetratricopeptide repeat protein [Thermoanaerobaculia bacterium]|nr:tetratricopeptide repeat protein [Thermoanaerobaculia bacterium]